MRAPLRKTSRNVPSAPIKENSEFHLCSSATAIPKHMDYPPRPFLPIHLCGEYSRSSSFPSSRSSWFLSSNPSGEDIGIDDIDFAVSGVDRVDVRGVGSRAPSRIDTAAAGALLGPALLVG